jgi:hypothetical protein
MLPESFPVFLRKRLVTFVRGHSWFFAIDWADAPVYQAPWEDSQDEKREI